ncbi:unnamed protein product [Lactuca saligna]|uniref:Uncharacterized protein n=1 Tax=Lactuca saligna TaxID=75948 RepID=A0AA35ZE99_LACSI|nr:unnamed protein product [Lactuca saligna]
MSKSKPKTVEKEVSAKNVPNKSRKRGSNKDTKEVPEKSIVKSTCGSTENPIENVAKVVPDQENIRSLNDKEPSSKAPTLLRTIETYRDNEATKDDLFNNDDETFCVSPRKDTTVESNFEETSILDVNVNVSDIDTNINFGEQIITSLPEQTQVTPTEIPIAESNMEEGIISNITKNISNMNSDVNIGDGSSISITETTPIPPPTSTIIPTSVLVVSPTFQSVMNETVASLFSLKSTDPEETFNEEEDDGDKMVGFA